MFVYIQGEMENVALLIKIVSDFWKYSKSDLRFSEGQDLDQDHIKEDHKHLKVFLVHNINIL